MSETPPRADTEHRGAGAEPDILAEIQAEVAQDLADDRPPRGGLGYQLVSAIAVITLGAVAATLAYGYGLGSLRRPGPGLWPLVVSVAIVALGVTLLVVGRRLDDSEKFTRSSLLVLVGGATFVLLGVLMPVVGFEIPSVLLGVIWLRFLGGESWRSTVTISVGITAAFYLLFLYGLSIPLPHLIAF